ncbi:unnamed protein product [Pleuronectes platessa]|uniref:Uncharacterized protein n=1 Tax=Pleuronectes platessa TaxID=8262 RepID=A0A9N7YY23_PLEPL|nr:unnamed protein product [Pleuronectes platessa]
MDCVDRDAARESESAPGDASPQPDAPPPPPPPSKTPMSHLQPHADMALGVVTGVLQLQAERPVESAGPGIGFRPGRGVVTSAGNKGFCSAPVEL